MLNVNEIQFAFEIAITSYVFCCILIDVDGIFEFYGDFLYNIKQSKPKLEFILKPFGRCEHCFAGQVSFWIWLAFNFKEYNLISHIIFVSINIFLTFTLKILINKWKN